MCNPRTVSILLELRIVLYGQSDADHRAYICRFFHDGFLERAWSSLVLKQPLDYRALLGGGIGVFGLIILFRVELLGFSWVSSGSIALLLSLLGTLAASVGNLVSATLQKRDLNVWNSTAFGMMYGTAITFMFALINGYPIRFDFNLCRVLTVFGVHRLRGSVWFVSDVNWSDWARQSRLCDRKFSGGCDHSQCSL